MINYFQFFVFFKISHLLRTFDNNSIFETLIWSNHEIFKIVEQPFDFEIKIDVKTTLIGFLTKFAKKILTRRKWTMLT